MEKKLKTPFLLKKNFKELNLGRLFAVFTIAVMAAFLNIFHVLKDLIKTPPDFFYTGTGHYYLDYFHYLQLIGSGIRGKWLPENYMAATDSFAYLLYLPYTLLGQIAGFFHLSAVFAYWSAIFLLTVITICLLYFALNKILKNQPFYLKISALLIAVFTCPFYFFKNSTLVFYELWWAPQTFLKRFGTVPHQLLANLLVLTVYLTTSLIIEKSSLTKLKSSLKKTLGLNLLLLTILFISPVSLAIPLITIFTIFLIESVRKYLKQKTLKAFIPLLIFCLLTSLLLFPAALKLKAYYEQSPILTELRAQEIGWNQTLPLKFLLLNIGPVLLFIPFGLKRFLKTKKPLAWLLLLSTTLTYILHYTSLTTLFGTHSLRLYSLTNYLTFAVLTVLGIKTIAGFLPKKRKVFTLTLVLILLAVFTVFNYLRILNSNQRIPTTNISYLPKTLNQTFEFLNKQQDKGCLLTGPYSYMGMVTPVYVERRSCLGKHIYTPGFEQKQRQTDLFLKGTLTKKEAKVFLNQNQVKYLLLTSLDTYQEEGLKKYGLLTKIFENPSSSLFKYND